MIPPAASSFMPPWCRARARRSTAAGAAARPRARRGRSGYFWMQVSAVSLVHSSRPVNTGSATSLPSIRSIITVGAM